MSQEYLIKSESLTAIADEVRTLSGTTELMGLDDMATNVGEANTEIDNQVELLAQAVAALEGKASGSGVTLPTLDNPASASDILNGKEAIDSEGNVITGTITAKTASSLTASGATVTVPAGYYASQVTKSVATATQATPSVSVNNSGLITASATQTAGYVSAGTKSGTKQLTTQASKTITPSTSSQTAVASGVYTTGAVTVAGDANLKAENIAEGVSIFGVTGTHSSASGIIPSGTLNITENGTYDVTEYASAEVTVAVGNICYIGAIEPSEGLGIDGDIYIMQEA